MEQYREPKNKPHLFKIFYLFIFREREREGVKLQCVVASRVLPTGDVACHPGMCPHWESNWQHFGSQAHTQSTELHQPGNKPHSYGQLIFDKQSKKIQWGRQFIQ